MVQLEVVVVSGSDFVAGTTSHPCIVDVICDDWLEDCGFALSFLPLVP